VETGVSAALEYRKFYLGGAILMVIPRPMTGLAQDQDTGAAGAQTIEKQLPDPVVRGGPE
jgi:hypothetical protein